MLEPTAGCVVGGVSGQGLYSQAHPGQESHWGLRGGIGLPGGKEKGMRVWITAQRKGCGRDTERQHEPLERKSKRQKPMEQKLGLCTGQVAKGPLSAGLGDVRTLSPGETLWWREAGSTPTKKTLVYTCRHCSRNQEVPHT